MDETQWDIQEVKQLKKKQLVQSNFFMLLIFVLFVYFSKSGQPLFLIGLFYVIVLIYVAFTLYVLMTGRFVGTKTSKRVQQFDKERLGKKRWTRRKIIEAVFLIVLSISITVLIVNTDIDPADRNNSIGAFPFFGAWVGYNLGELFRMGKL
ncbi:hypothetical protein [Planococcus sp. YIM B11945]|uniref:hypothetical protein n=1 Tax=Planococcus sp. YIM B11945 TaxID=3435410 RepID=UPI003D7D813F